MPLVHSAMATQRLATLLHLLNFYVVYLLLRKLQLDWVLQMPLMIRKTFIIGAKVIMEFLEMATIKVSVLLARMSILKDCEMKKILQLSNLNLPIITLWHLWVMVNFMVGDLMSMARWVLRMKLEWSFMKQLISQLQLWMKIF